jgi:GNAT superfamily N-acetyltransferase
LIECRNLLNHFRIQWCEMCEEKKIIKGFEELSLNSWPSLQTLLFDGWVLRFANGFTKRSNSISPLFSSGLNPGEKIRYCENLYQNLGLDTVFKMTSAVYPANLDEILEAKGYIINSPTSVQILDLSDCQVSPLKKAILSSHFTDEWLSDFCRLVNLEEKHQSTLKKILTNIVTPTCFACLGESEEKDTISCGLGVLQDKYFALYDIVTAANSRNRGFGKQVVLNLLNWGKEKGARTVYLHVMLNNEPALRLYSQLGFKEIYRYWYRIKARV